MSIAGYQDTDPIERGDGACRPVVRHVFELDDTADRASLDARYERLQEGEIRAGRAATMSGGWYSRPYTRYRRPAVG